MSEVQVGQRREGDVPRCPKGEGKCYHQPLYSHPTISGWLQCRRCAVGYAPDDPAIVYAPAPRRLRGPTVGGKAIGGLLLGQELLDKLDEIARRRGLSRAELIRRYVSRGIKADSARDGA